MTSLERRVIVEIMSKIRTDKAAEEIADMLVVSKREIDGAGFITEFRPDTLDSQSPDYPKELTLVGEHPRLSEGAIFTLFFRPGGAIGSVEGATFAGEAWPEDDESFRFHGA